MKNKKTVIMIVLIIVAYSGIAIILFGWENFKNMFQGMNIMVSNGEKWQLKNGEWSNIEDDNDYNWKKFDVYIDNQLLGDYDLLYNNKWYIFDKNRESINYDGRILAIRGNKKYEVIDFQEKEFDAYGQSLLNEILKERNIEYFEDADSTKVSLDIDGDQEIETIYTSSTAFTNEINIDSLYSIVFIEDNGIQVLYQDYKTEASRYSMCVPKVNSIIDIDKDSKYEIIIECNYYSTMGTCSSLYEPKNGKYVLSKGC